MEIVTGLDISADTNLCLDQVKTGENEMYYMDEPWTYIIADGQVPHHHVCLEKKHYTILGEFFKLFFDSNTIFNF